jgi:hypothetical protein
MPILSLQINEPGQAGVKPAIVRIQTNDTLAEVLVTGYLDHQFAENIPIQNGMMALVETKPSQNSPITQSSWLDVTFASGRWSLTPTAVAPGSITLPTIANHIAVFTDVAGSLAEDTSVAINGGNIQAGLSGTAGYLASFPSAALKGSFRVTAVANTGDTLVTLSNVAHGQASVYSIPDAGNAVGRILAGASATPFVTNHILTASGTGGVVSNDAATAINGGNIQAGLSGTAGYLASFPSTALKGSFRVVAVDNTGDTLVTLSNVAHGQATVYSIPDAGNALGRVLVGATATPFTTAHLLASSGTGGLVADSGIATAAVQLSANIKAATTGNIGGAGAGPITVTVAGLTTASVVVCTIESSSNAVSVLHATAGTGNFDVTFSGDPGASCLLNYVAFIAAQ